MKTGYTKAYRKELESDIWKMPPLYQRVFFYLRQKACWEPRSFPTKKHFKIAINPGQIITSLSIIADGVAWYEYGVKKTPNKKTIKKILEWLESNSMGTVVSNRYGTFINITNWDTYNPVIDEKVTQSTQVKVTPRKRHVDTVKEDISLKEINNTTTTPLELPSWLKKEDWDSYIEHRKSFKPKMTDHAEKLCLGRLKKLHKDGHDAKEIIEQTIMNGWKSFFPEKQKNNKPKHTFEVIN